MATRIIGGVAGGRRLRTPSGGATRPTSDRVREALFSAVEATHGSFEGRAVLDLYAGSGAVGLEARSRGAAPVTLVERDKRVAALIRDNARALGLHEGVEVRAMAVGRFLDEAPPLPVDWAFLDPPYAGTEREVAAALAALAGREWLAPGALVVVERSARTAVPAWPTGFEPGRVRTYGETALAFATWEGARLRYRPASQRDHEAPEEAGDG